MVEDDQRVKKGDLLVAIDPRDYQAALDQARAQLAQARRKSPRPSKIMRRR